MFEEIFILLVDTRHLVVFVCLRVGFFSVCLGCGSVLAGYLGVFVMEGMDMYESNGIFG